MIVFIFAKLVENSMTESLCIEDLVNLKIYVQHSLNLHKISDFLNNTILYLNSNKKSKRLLLDAFYRKYSGNTVNEAAEISPEYTIF